MFCSQCGTNNAENAAFCAGCGAPLANEPIKQEVPIQDTPMQPENPVYQAPQNDFQPSYTPTPNPSLPGKGMGIAGMILGIASIVFMCTFYLAIPCAIVGLILSCCAKSKAKKAGMKNGFAVAGIITSSIGLAVAVISIVLTVIGIGILAEYGYDLEEMLEEYEYYYYEYSVKLRNLFK